MEIESDFEKLLKDNFDLVDTDSDGYLSPDEVVLLFRGLGQTPSDSKMKLEMFSLTKKTDLTGFKKFYAKCYASPCTEINLLKSFKVFDSADKGKMSASKFRELTTSLGDGLSHAEVDEILKAAKVPLNGTIDLSYFARMLTGGSF